MTESKIKAQDTGKRVDIKNIPAKKTTLRSRIKKEIKKPVNIIEQPKIEEEKSSATKSNIQDEKPALIVSHVEQIEFDDSGDFAALLAENETGLGDISLKIGEKVSGKVVHIGKENIFVALGPKLEAAISTQELRDESGELLVKLGEEINSYVISTTGGVTLSNQMSRAGLDASMLEDACAQGTPVEGKVIAANKGGFDIQIATKKAFCPVSQIDAKFVEDTSSYIGRTLNFRVQRYEEGGRNIVVSHRVILEQEIKEKAEKLVKKIQVGENFTGVVKRIADFGAFVDIGGLEGLLPRSEISHGRVDKVQDVLSPNDRVTVQVLNFEPNEEDITRSKLSFSLKKTQPDPYTEHWHKIKVGNILEGRVVRMESFGVFVELFSGIDGLIHISELSQNRISHPKEILNIGDPVSVRVLRVDEEEKRIALSLREEVVKKNTAAQQKIPMERGQKAFGVVSRIERYGVFLELDNGVTALMPGSETGLPKHSDLARNFTLGDKLEVLIIEIDEQNRVRVSRLAREKLEERDSFIAFQAEEHKKSSFGTFADLLKKKK